MIEVRIEPHGLYRATLDQVSWIERNFTSNEIIKRICEYREGEPMTTMPWYWDRFPIVALVVMLADLMQPVRCATCEDMGMAGTRHYPGGDPENGPAHYR